MYRVKSSMRKPTVNLCRWNHLKAELAEQIQVALCLIRAPKLTRTMEPFEELFYEYQRKLAARRSAPFVGQFFFKKGSIAGKLWQETKLLNRKSVREGTGNSKAPIPVALEKEFIEAEKIKRELLPRTSNCDSDLKSLQRKLDKALYLIIKTQDGWTLPYKTMQGSKSLDELVDPIVQENFGQDVKKWIVSPKPIAFFKYSNTCTRFYLKVRFLSGQIKISPQVLDFAWVTSDEIEDFVAQNELKVIRNVLTQR